MNEKNIICKLKFFFVLDLVLLTALFGCRSEAPVMHRKAPTGSVAPEPDMAALYKAISIRDSGAILHIAEAGSGEAAGDAWRALHVTKVNPDSLFLAATADGSYLAWFALSGHAINQSQLSDLEQRWLSEPNDRAGISLVLGLQGDEQCLEFLVKNHGEVTGTEEEYPVALAINRLALRFKHQVSADSLVRWSVNSHRNDLFQAYLYAGYRSAASIIPENLDKLLLRYWNTHPEMKDLSKQFLVNILAKNSDPNLLNRLAAMKLETVDPTVGVGIAKALSHYPINDTTWTIYKRLLNNDNDNVGVETLLSLNKHDSIPVRIDSTLKVIVTRSYPDHAEVYVKAMDVLVRNEPDQTVVQTKHLHQLLKNDPYVAGDVISLLRYLMSRTRYMQYVAGLVDSPDIRIAEAAISVIWHRWQDFSPMDKMRNENVFRSALIHALERGDRGLTYFCAPILQDSTIWQNTNTALMQTVVGHFKFPDDIEAYEALVPVLVKRYGWWGRSLVDSLAARRYPVFNTFLKRFGLVNIPDGNQRLYPLYTPDWQRLQQLGPAPVWTLQTGKGTVTIELDASRCPATVSAIDRLTREGKFDGVPFHRVVPDFVIQGGDFERGDGFGGASFVLPTEPSELEFTRGAAGMASAGYDTEGSQYFIMHQWAPHLNGHYTLFGEVMKGMDVVDRITPGDKVLHATISPTSEDVKREK